MASRTNNTPSKGQAHDVHHPGNNESSNPWDSPSHRIAVRPIHYQLGNPSQAFTTAGAIGLWIYDPDDPHVAVAVHDQQIVYIGSATGCCEHLSTTDEFQQLRSRAELRRIKLHGLRNTSVSLMLNQGHPRTSSRPDTATIQLCLCRSMQT